jgi:hypothetical protein
LTRAALTTCGFFASTIIMRRLSFIQLSTASAMRSDSCRISVCALSSASARSRSKPSSEMPARGSRPAARKMRAALVEIFISLMLARDNVAGHGRVAAGGRRTVIKPAAPMLAGARPALRTHATVLPSHGIGGRTLCLNERLSLH